MIQKYLILCNLFQNLYNSKLNELNKEDKNIENYSKHNIINKKDQLKNISEKLQQITSANTNLNIEINGNKI